MGTNQIDLGTMDNAKECLDACKERKKNDSTINGLSIDVFSICFCDKTMISRTSDNDYKSCYLEPGKIASR